MEGVAAQPALNDSSRSRQLEKEAKGPTPAARAWGSENKVQCTLVNDRSWLGAAWKQMGRQLSGEGGKGTKAEISYPHGTLLSGGKNPAQSGVSDEWFQERKDQHGKFQPI